MDRNPYTLTFGKSPDQMIERLEYDSRLWAGDL